MTESTRIVDRVQTSIDRILDDQAALLAEVSPDLAPFVDASRELLAGGKRFRAQFCYWGWRAGGGDPGSELQAVASAATALEFFHAAALVHDDIIDNSDTRRGKPAAHRRFKAMHAAEGWSGDASSFGRSSAILLGDLLLGWSDEILDDGIQSLRDVSAARAARREFNRMRTEVTAGQYLDVLEEHSWRSWADDLHLERAQRVIVYKSAKYSVEAPLLIGAMLGGGSLGVAEGLRGFGLPLGIAYQLRDDLLGVFGDPTETGKPSGDDLREGKRTVLVAQARRRLSAPSARLLDELLGDPELSDEQVRTLQSTLRQSGAVEDVERAIARNADRARASLADCEIDAVTRGQLLALVEAVTQRVV
ncbi:polyprenyl synthetase family protein [Salinibacterium sp. SYSU T00001]|uniref:polyprenyl synthetase family protein n=1 Tax=Homoserinimonas sedimenticola TaxID=2986805 RepID=UPI002235EBBE|nr:polyprenyl synthetase family protein [Salinibacterium sedimenticola]MCW4384268.1 polyprenyl synthetase family protein [Salinibacterium sedimenticola]